MTKKSLLLMASFAYAVALLNADSVGVAPDAYLTILVVAPALVAVKLVTYEPEFDVSAAAAVETDVAPAVAPAIVDAADPRVADAPLTCADARVATFDCLVTVMV